MSNGEPYTIIESILEDGLTAIADAIKGPHTGALEFNAPGIYKATEHVAPGTATQLGSLTAPLFSTNLLGFELRAMTTNRRTIEVSIYSWSGNIIGRFELVDHANRD